VVTDPERWTDSAVGSAVSRTATAAISLACRLFAGCHAVLFGTFTEPLAAAATSGILRVGAPFGRPITTMFGRSRNGVPRDCATGKDNCADGKKSRHGADLARIPGGKVLRAFPVGFNTNQVCPQRTTLTRSACLLAKQPGSWAAGLSFVRTFAAPRRGDRTG
jgi:hypothetical protein